MNVNVLGKLDDEGFKQALYFLYMYPLSSLLLPFGWQPVILYHSLENLTFLAIKGAFVSDFSSPTDKI